MKKLFLVFAALILSFALLAQEIQHETIVVNIEVPVRVFDKGQFVENLTIDDFEIFEDGRLQKTEAVYLIKKTNIERKEEEKPFDPKTQRHFYFFFIITDYSYKIEESLSYFFNNMLIPGDSVTIITSSRSYTMKSQTLEHLPGEEIVNQLGEILRRDTLTGNFEYRSVINELATLARELSSSSATLDVTKASGYEGMFDEEILILYQSVLDRLDSLRQIDQQILLDFAKHLKCEEGQKYVYLFYQKEFIPQLVQRETTQISLSQDYPNIITRLYEAYRRDVSFDVNKVKQAFSDSSISIHFLFFTPPPEHIPGINMVEASEDVFEAFMQMAKATGGTTESSSNPNFLFKKAAEASENYYLLYYSPINYKKDGKFHNIKIKVNNKSYRILHRAGYFAN